MVLWRDDVVEALRRIGGTGHLSQIYEKIREVRSGPLPKNLRAIVRKELEYNSSDTDAFQNKRDLFYSVEGIGSGVWGLRERLFQTIDPESGEYTGRWLVLTENEVNANPGYDWKDKTGIQYHFPHQYRWRMETGTRFIYYRGSLRADGKKRTPEYFGRGVVGRLWQDPETDGAPLRQQAWYCSIVDYEEFEKSVPFKDDKGVYLEAGSSEVARNYFRNGFRTIEKRNFDHILHLAGIAGYAPALVQGFEQKPALREADLLVQRATGEREKANGAKVNWLGERRSKSAKDIGDLGEKLVLDHLRDKASSPGDAMKIVWSAQLGEKPGYDIEDRREKGAVVGYEVKSTTGSAFSSFDLTENELRSAREMGERYVLVLVSNVETKSPKIQLLCNPAKMLDEGELNSRPVVFRIDRPKKDE